MIRKPPIPSDESDEDNIFETIKKTPSKTNAPPSTTSSITKPKPPSPEDDLSITKPPSTAAAQISDDDDPLFGIKPSVQQPAALVIPPSAPNTIPPVKKSARLSDADSEDELFGIKPTEPKTQLPKVVPSTKTDVQDESFGKPTAKSNIPTTETKPTIPSVKSIHDDDDDDDLFKPPLKSEGETKKIEKRDTTIDFDDDNKLRHPEPLKVNLPPPPTLISFPSAPTDKTDVDGDPLRLVIPVKTTSQPPVTNPVKAASVSTNQLAKSNLSDSDEDEDSSRNKNINPGAVKEGQTISVKNIAVRSIHFQKRILFIIFFPSSQV